TMPGRFKLQKFMAQAKKAGCKFVVLEVTSEGIKQKRHLGIKFDCAVFTNLHKEHLESHGSFENYYQAKQELFKRTDNIHVLNVDDKHFKLFSDFHAKHKIFYGITGGDMKADNVRLGEGESSFEVYGTEFNVHFGGRFNVYNSLAALAVGAMYGIDLPRAKPVLESITTIKGRMEYVQKTPFSVVIDYAHTPDSLEEVYKTLKPKDESLKLICVLGAAGGGRDKWKRPEFGKIAEKYCDQIILTDEDPYDENPEEILNQISSGFSQTLNSKLETLNHKKILDRREAIKTAINMAEPGDTVVITGKGSEVSMAVAGGKKIPWSDGQIVLELLQDHSN
ncbi:MAG: UDP-N-acetylmuramoyl-L-alanyl-D-glutamate--2,6-diaminopimelate ligase, partial [Candidatus Paceibacterota bacterium]